jgi:hypothetical protein
MNLGHWALVSRSIVRLLARSAALFAGLAVFRTVYLGVAMAVQRHSEGVQILVSLDGSLFLFRVLWGIAGRWPASCCIWRTAGSNPTSGPPAFSTWR